MENLFSMKQTLRILFLEDSQRDFEIISELLTENGIELIMERVENQHDYILSLQNQSYDVIFSDFTLPDFNAFGALKYALQICPQTPFIVVSGSIGEETAIELIKKGAIDYVLKDRIERLPYCVKRSLVEVKEIESRKKIEEALRKSEEEFRGLFENVPVGIYRASLDGQILKANPFLVKMLGYNFAEEFLKHNPSRDGFESSYSMAELKSKIEKQKVIQALEAQWKLKDGKVIYVSISANLVSDENDNALYYDGIVEDITERRKSEKEIKKRIDDLEHFHKITVGRELTMIELKKEINSLLEQIGKEQKYLLIDSE